MIVAIETRNKRRTSIQIKCNNYSSNIFQVRLKSRPRLASGVFIEKIPA